MKESQKTLREDLFASHESKDKHLTALDKIILEDQAQVGGFSQRKHLMLPFLLLGTACGIALSYKLSNAGIFPDNHSIRTYIGGAAIGTVYGFALNFVAGTIVHECIAPDGELRTAAQKIRQYLSRKNYK